MWIIGCRGTFNNTDWRSWSSMRCTSSANADVGDGDRAGICSSGKSDILLTLTGVSKTLNYCMHWLANEVVTVTVYDFDGQSSVK